MNVFLLPIIFFVTYIIQEIWKISNGMRLFFEIRYKHALFVKDFGDSAPVLELNGDFTPIFLTLRFYPCFFRLMLPFAPSLKVC
jgi:hypothetical protein